MQNDNELKRGKKKRFLRVISGAALAATLAFGGGSLAYTNVTNSYAQTAPAETPATGDTTLTPSNGQTYQSQTEMNGRKGGRGQNQDGSKQNNSNHRHGTVSAVSSDSLTITLPDNTTLKVALSSSTTYTDLDKTVTIGDIKNGIKVEVDGSVNTDGSFQATAVRIEHDRLGGVVTAVSGNSITVQLDGRGAKGMGRGNPNTDPSNGAATTPAAGTVTTKTIVVDSNTVYSAAGQTAKLSDIVVGSQIEAQGTISSDGNSLTALQVSIRMPDYHGQVTAVSGSTITVQDREGTHTIEVNSSTKYLNGSAEASLSDVTSGVNLRAEGTIDSSGKMIASLIQLGQPQKGAGHGHGR